MRRDLQDNGFEGSLSEGVAPNIELKEKVSKNSTIYDIEQKRVRDEL